MTTEKPSRITPEVITCLRKRLIVPHLMRVTFSCDAATAFSKSRLGAHIKLFFPNQTSQTLELPVLEDGKITWPQNKPVTRAYTVRDVRHELNEIDVDFVIHGDKSPASGWAVHAQQGDQIGMVGPAGPDPLLAPSDWHLLVGDLTALPAISAIVSQLSTDAAGHIFVEIDHPDDIHDFEKPSNIGIDWLIRDPKQNKHPLVNAVKNHNVPTHAKTVSAFVAGENTTVIECRNWLKKQYSLNSKSLYAIPYWKRGEHEDQYHDERHVVMDEHYA